MSENSKSINEADKQKKRAKINYYIVGALIIVVAFIVTLPKSKKESEPVKAISRKDSIENMFALDGSQKKLREYVKEKLNDPESFEAIKTEYWDHDSDIVVKMVFTAKNGYGGRVKQTIMARCNINGDISEIMAYK